MRYWGCVLLHAQLDCVVLKTATYENSSDFNAYYPPLPPSLGNLIQSHKRVKRNANSVWRYKTARIQFGVSPFFRATKQRGLNGDKWTCTYYYKTCANCHTKFSSVFILFLIVIVYVLGSCRDASSLVIIHSDFLVTWSCCTDFYASFAVLHCCCPPSHTPTPTYTHTLPTHTLPSLFRWNPRCSGKSHWVISLAVVNRSSRDAFFFSFLPCSVWKRSAAYRVCQLLY